MATKRINVHFDQRTFDELEAVKGDRTWVEAITEEFGVADGTEVDGE